MSATPLSPMRHSFYTSVALFLSPHKLSFVTPAHVLAIPNSAALSLSWHSWSLSQSRSVPVMIFLFYHNVTSVTAVVLHYQTSDKFILSPEWHSIVTPSTLHPVLPVSHPNATSNLWHCLPLSSYHLNVSFLLTPHTPPPSLMFRSAKMSHSKYSNHWFI